MDLKHQPIEFSRKLDGGLLPIPIVEDDRREAFLPITLLGAAAVCLIAFLFATSSFQASQDFSGARSARPGAITQTTALPGTRQ